FELRVEIDLVVDGIDEAVQALAGVHVVEMRVDDEFVVGGEPRKGDAGRSDRLGEVEVDSVESDAFDAGGDGVDECRRLRHRGEADARVRAETLALSREDQGVLVARDVHDLGTFACFVAGEVVLRHSEVTSASGTGCTRSFFHGLPLSRRRPPEMEVSTAFTPFGRPW